MSLRCLVGLTVCCALLACDDPPLGPPIGVDAALPAADGSAHDAALDASSLDAGSLLDATSTHEDGSSLQGVGDTLPAARGWPACDSLPEEFRFKVLLDAASYGAGAELVALDGPFLILRTPLSDRVLSVRPAVDASGPELHSWAVPSERIATAIADAVSDVGAPDGAHVLTCPRAAGACSLMRLEPAAASLSEVANSALPAGFVATGIDAFAEQLCVHGGALLCFRNGAWTELIEPLAGGDRIEGLSLRPPMLAVSKLGRVWNGALRALDGRLSFTERSPLAQTELHRVSTNGRTGFVTGVRDGAPEAFAWDGGALTPLRLADGVNTAWVGDYESRILTGAGDLLLHSTLYEQPAWCLEQRLALATPVLAESSSPCGLASNLRLLTAQQLLGQNLCILD